MNLSRGRHTSALALLVSASMAMHAVGCGDSTSRRGEVLQEQHQRASLEEYIAQLEAAVTEAVRTRVIEAAVAPSLKRVFENDPELAKVNERHLNRLRAFYEARNFEPLFVEDGNLSEAGIFLAQTFIAVDRHGLNPDDFHAKEIQAALNRIASGLTASAHVDEIKFTEDDRTSLLAMLGSIYAESTKLPPIATTLDVMLNDASTSPVPRLAQIVGEIEALPSDGQLALNELDVLLADAWLRFGIAQRFGNLRYVDTETATQRQWIIMVDGKEYSTKQPGSPRREPVVDRTNFTTISGEDVALTFALESLENAASTGSFIESFDSLNPPFEQYTLLVQAGDRYRDIIRKGGWQELPAETTHLRAGDMGPQVAALRNRLAIEGYLPEPGEPLFNNELRRAITTFQATHQFEQSGIVSEETLASLNIPAERRLAQILVTLGHWRETRIGEDWDDEYIFVNVPDFHMELWDKQELITRHATVVGRPRVLSNGVVGRTILFSDELTYVVFNPYWNVPQSIWRNEYAHKIESDPTWLESNNFEIITNEQGNNFLRQRPGPSNALGFVKFLFPNEHDIYLHDTPSRNLFSRPHRAFSHGCVRVHDALGFSRILLQRDRDLSEDAARREVNRLLAMTGEQWITLRRFIPVHIEYYVVRVNEDGHTEFLSDLHRTDRPLVEAKEQEILKWVAQLQAQQANLAVPVDPEPAIVPAPTLNQAPSEL